MGRTDYTIIASISYAGISHLRDMERRDGGRTEQSGRECTGKITDEMQRKRFYILGKRGGRRRRMRKGKGNYGRRK